MAQESEAAAELRAIDGAGDYIAQLFSGDSGGHDAAHTLRVYRTAMAIAAREPAADVRIVALAALLHDADDHKLFNTANNANARAYMQACGVAQARANMVCEAINSVSYSRNGGRAPSTLEGMIVQDADRLDALGAIGIARTFAYGGQHGRALEESVQHFYDKLLRLRDTMNTAEGRALASSRHEFLESFLAEWYAETGDAPYSDSCTGDSARVGDPPETGDGSNA